MSRAGSAGLRRPRVRAGPGGHERRRRRRCVATGRATAAARPLGRGRCGRAAPGRMRRVRLTGRSCAGCWTGGGRKCGETAARRELRRAAAGRDRRTMDGRAIHCRARTGGRGWGGSCRAPAPVCERKDAPRLGPRGVLQIRFAPATGARRRPVRRPAFRSRLRRLRRGLRRAAPPRCGCRGRRIPSGPSRCARWARCPRR